ncbi:Holliday junction branch migration protein RuvA [Hamadaea tsunoensis]|uniref:Holliday junction branch migration protein RuvA n=1 Tax=Hamadaea tsunoensis TaxID=53368 RepID=UPI0003FDB897|nr:Holliday junction branch migration protein RuvA [Hamadaea tsunoensis]
MIASVAGQVASVGADRTVIEVGGVGLAVFCTPTTLAGLRVGQAARLSTSLIVREDALTLYGFADDDERELFDLLQTVSGVGPRVAQAVLSVHNPDVVRNAIASGELGVLTKVPGIGKKGAERIILELRDKVGPVTPGAAAGVPRQLAWQDQVRQGLVGLGWTASQADHAITSVASSLEDGPTPAVPVLLRQAIKLLGRAR